MLCVHKQWGALVPEPAPVLKPPVCTHLQAHPQPHVRVNIKSIVEITMPHEKNKVHGPGSIWDAKTDGVGRRWPAATPLPLSPAPFP